MRDFCDTDTFRQNSFFSAVPDALMLHLFVDAFETVNVLGSHTTVHKLEGLTVYSEMAQTCTSLRQTVFFCLVCGIPLM